MRLTKNYKSSERGVGLFDKKADNFDQKAKLLSMWSVFDCKNENEMNSNDVCVELENQHQGEARQAKMAAAPSEPEFEDEEMNEEMVKIQITLEEEKRDRLRRVEERRREDEEREAQRFLAEVMRMEESGANVDDQAWLEEALRMEEGESNQPPTPPPSLQAKMPIGAEPWRKLEEGRRKENEESSMTMDSQEAEVSKSIPSKPVRQSAHHPSCL